MPCYEAPIAYNDYLLMHESDAVRHLKERGIDVKDKAEAVRMLCKLCRKHPPTRGSLKYWWQDHQEIDAVQAALARLTPEEQTLVKKWYHDDH